MMCSWSEANRLYARISSGTSGFTSLTSLRSTGGTSPTRTRRLPKANASCTRTRTPPGQLVGPAHLSVILIAVLAHHGMERLAHLRDLPPAEILVAAVVVQAQHGREPALRPGRLQKDGLGRRPVRQPPGEVLDVQPIILQNMMHLALGHSARIGLEEAGLQPAPRLAPPGVDIRRPEPLLAERQPRRRVPGQADRPGTIRTDHVRFHSPLSRPLDEDLLAKPPVHRSRARPLFSPPASPPASRPLLEDGRGARSSEECDRGRWSGGGRLPSRACPGPE